MNSGESASLNICSQPTYEELKRDLCKIGFGAIYSSQPTYEELKHEIHEYKNYKLISSQPTYEELKPAWLNAHTETMKVPSLPMRN